MARFIIDSSEDITYRFSIEINDNGDLHLTVNNRLILWIEPDGELYITKGTTVITKPDTHYNIAKLNFKEIK